MQKKKTNEDAELYLINPNDPASAAFWISEWEIEEEMDDGSSREDAIEFILNKRIQGE